MNIYTLQDIYILYCKIYLSDLVMYMYHTCSRIKKIHYTHTRTLTRAHTSALTQRERDTHTHARTHTHTHTSALTHTERDTHTHTHTHTQRERDTHTHTHERTHTHTQRERDTHTHSFFTCHLERKTFSDLDSSCVCLTPSIRNKDKSHFIFICKLIYLINIFYTYNLEIFIHTI